MIEPGRSRPEAALHELPIFRSIPHGPKMYTPCPKIGNAQSPLPLPLPPILSHWVAYVMDDPLGCDCWKRPPPPPAALLPLWQSATAEGLGIFLISIMPLGYHFLTTKSNLSEPSHHVTPFGDWEFWNLQPSLIQF